MIYLLSTLSMAEPIRIGSQKQLFIDDYLVHSSSNIELTVNQPVKDPEPVMKPNHPHELLWALYNQILYDEGKFKMWYQARYERGWWVAYAESEDGIHWERPNLNLIEVEGKTNNNYVFPHTESAYMVEFGNVFIDTNPDCPPSEKYKMNVRWRPRGAGGHKIWVCTSPDGIHWKTISDKPSFRDSDTGNVFFWDEKYQKYVAYVRRWEKFEDKPPRVVTRCEFEDIQNWGQDKLVLATDNRDPKDIDLYTNCTVKYEGVYFMFPSILHTPKQRAGLWKDNHGVMDVQLAVSRDGINWSRPDRKPFVPLSHEGEWDSQIIYMFTGYVVQGDEIWMYYWGRNYPHGTSKQYKYKPMETGMGRLRLRLDGFISADAAYTGGELITKPFIFEGDKLALNIHTSVAGFTKVEIQDASGTPIKGFTLDDSDEIKGNFLDHNVSWNNEMDVSSLAGKPIRLRFVMRDTKLYAFQFEK